MLCIPRSRANEPTLASAIRTCRLSGKSRWVGLPAIVWVDLS
jgi:hypothetical protein